MINYIVLWENGKTCLQKELQDRLKAGWGYNFHKIPANTFLCNKVNQHIGRSFNEQHTS